MHGTTVKIVFFQLLKIRKNWGAWAFFYLWHPKSWPTASIMRVITTTKRFST